MLYILIRYAILNLIRSDNMRKFLLILLTLSITFILCSCVKIDIHIEPSAKQYEKNVIHLSECTPDLPLVPENMPNIENESKNIPLPVITKQPVGENVESGSRTWLISQADSADGMRWHFRQPDTTVDYDITSTLSALPGLELEVLDKGTLALRNIPAEMDDWSIRAEFYNAAGSVYSDWAVIKVVNTLELYKPIFDNLRYIIDVYNNETQYAAANDKYSLNNCFGYTGVDGVGYKLDDLDNNGVKELILGYSNGSPEICGIFTLRDNYPVVLGRSSGRSFLRYAGGNRLYYSCGAGGPSIKINTIYEVNGAVLDTVRCCFSFLDADDIFKSYYAEGIDVVNLEGSNSIENYRISDSEAETLHNTIANSVTLKPLTDLIPVV